MPAGVGGTCARHCSDLDEVKTDWVENILAVGGVQGDARRVNMDIDASTVQSMGPALD